MAMERTYIMAKPDAVQRGIVSDIVGRFEKKGYKLVALKLVKPPRSLLEEHYESLKVSRQGGREGGKERGKR
jgi:nucleoside-diphosphate kinase